MPQDMIDIVASINANVNVMKAMELDSRMQIGSNCLLARIMGS
jgi:hypothetical protein